MKARQTVESVRKNWPAVVVCVALALAFYLFFLFSTVDRKTFIVPLAIEAQNGMVAAGPVPHTVKVTVRGRPESISTLHENDFSACLDLNYVARDGEARLPVLVTPSEAAMLIDPMEIRVSPEEVLLTVEEQISAFVPVSALVSGEPAHGYEQVAVSLSPGEVRLTGPRSMVEQCTRLQTRPVSVAGARADVTEKVTLESPGAFLRTAPGMTVMVTVRVAESVATRAFAGVPVVVSSLGGAFELLGGVGPVTLTVRGTVRALDAFEPSAATVSADCSAVSSAGTQDVPLRVSLPAGLEAEGVAESVTVTVVRRADGA